MRKLALSDEILMSIEKPARYIGGEYNSVMKDKEQVDVRFCMCMRSECPISASRFYMTCSTGEKRPGVNVSILRGRICIKL